MRAKILVQPYAGGVVCTILDEGHTYQLGQSCVYESPAEAVEAAVNNMIAVFQCIGCTATVPPKELDFAGRIKELQTQVKTLTSELAETRVQLREYQA